MDELCLQATFADRRSADDVARAIALSVQNARITVGHLGVHEARIIWRIVLVIVVWSFVGAVIGALVGAGIALVIGPSGTEGLILQVVVWGIFAHLLAGMWAGYLLLADRSNRELPVKSAPVLLVVSCDSIEQMSVITESLRRGAALDITIGHGSSLSMTGGRHDAEHVPNR